MGRELADSEEMRAEATNLNHAHVTTFLGLVALGGSVVIQNRLKVAEGLDLGLAIGGAVTVVRGLGQTVSSAVSLATLKHERNYYDNNDDPEP